MNAWPYLTPSQHTGSHRREAHSDTVFAICTSTGTLYILLSLKWVWYGEWQLHQQKIDRSKMAPHTNGRTTSTRLHPSSLDAMPMQNVSSVWNDPYDMYDAPYSTKMTSETCGHMVRHISPTPTWYWTTPFRRPKHSQRCCVVSATTGDCKNWYAPTWQTLQSLSILLFPTTPTYQPNKQWKPSPLTS